MTSEHERPFGGAASGQPPSQEAHPSDSQVKHPQDVQTEDRAAAAPVEDAPDAARAEPMVVPRWVQAIVVAVALWGVASLARAAGSVLLIFLVAAVVALIVNPLVGLLQRARVPRGLAIGAVFLSFFATLGGAIVLLVRPVAAQVSAFQTDLPSLINSANASLAEFQRWLDGRGIGIQIKRPGETALETLQASILRGSGDVVAFTRDLVTLIAEAGFVLILILVIAIYMLLYGRQIGDLARRWMPPGDGSLEDDYPCWVQQAVSGCCAANSPSASSWVCPPGSRCGCSGRSGSSQPARPMRCSSACSTR
jgi:hypothetical protein